MSIRIYDQVVVGLARGLKNLDAVVTKAEEHAKEKEIGESVLISARLYPDMLPFIDQIRIATDTAKGAAARLTGTELPSWPDDETTFADAHARIKKALDFLATFEPAQFDGSETRKVELKLPNTTIEFSGKDYIVNFVLPNFYFHTTTAYNILRHNGVVIGKRDFLGG